MRLHRARRFDHRLAQPGELGKANLVMRDRRGRGWLTVTTPMQPWTESINSRAADGSTGTNEVRMDAKEEWLHVVESNARRISRLRVHDDGRLTDRGVYGPSALPGFPDGFAFDSFGNLWITLAMADRPVALTPEGELLTLLDDGTSKRHAASTSTTRRAR